MLTLAHINLFSLKNTTYNFASVYATRIALNCLEIFANLCHASKDRKSPLEYLLVLSISMLK